MTDLTDTDLRVMQAVRVSQKTVPIALLWNDENLKAHVEGKEFPGRVRLCIERIVAGEKLSLGQIAEAIGIPFVVLDAGYRCELAELGINPSNPPGTMVH
jgi:hypothetical protein